MIFIFHITIFIDGKSKIIAQFITLHKSYIIALYYASKSAQSIMQRILSVEIMNETLR